MPKRISCPNCGGPLAAASAGLNVQTYHAYVPAFGDWGFVLASNLKVDWSSLRLHAPTRFLKDELLPMMAGAMQPQTPLAAP
jgi:predicted membrane-bound spermidine synthase